MEKVRSGPRDLSSYKHLQCLKVNWQLWRSSALEIHRYSQSFGEKLFRSKVLKISKHHGMMIEPMSTNPKRIVCWSFGAFGQHRFFSLGKLQVVVDLGSKLQHISPCPKTFPFPQIKVKGIRVVIHMCWGLNSHYFHIIGDGHQPNSRGLYTTYKDSLLKVGWPSPI